MNDPPDSIRESDLIFERFVPTRQVRDFDSGEAELDAFLNTAEVRRYQEENFGVTTLVYYKRGGDPELVGFYTTSLGDLPLEKVKRVKSFTRAPDVKVVNLPSLMIGRFAVQKRWQGRGVGKTMMRRIMWEALQLQKSHGVRLLILNAKPNSVKFYESRGFVFTDQGREKSSRQRTMFFDLQSIADVA